MTTRKKKKTFTIKYTVWEYYQTEAYNRKEALQKPVSDPFFVDYKTKRIVKDIV